MGLFSRKKSSNADEGDDFPLATPLSGATKGKHAKATAAESEEWLEDSYEGQLAVDVYHDRGNLVVKSTIAGVRPQDLDIAITNDMVTIRGKREQDAKVQEENFLFRECYWGGFSRSIILPVEVRPEKANASLKNGVLTIVLPKASGAKSVTLQVKGD